MSERIEVRRNEDGTIDEVLLYIGDRCVFHMEQTTPASWYFGIYPEGDDGEQFYINAEVKKPKRAGRDAS